MGIIEWLFGSKKEKEKENVISVKFEKSSDFENSSEFDDGLVFNDKCSEFDNNYREIGSSTIHSMITGVPKQTLNDLQTELLDKGGSPKENEEKLVAILLGTDYKWEEYDKFYELFKNNGNFPSYWGEIIDFDDTLSDSSVGILNNFHKLSLPSRFILIKQGLYGKNILDFDECQRYASVTKNALKNSIKELEREGFVNTSLPVSRYLEKLKVNEIKQILKTYKLKITGKKAVLISAIINNIPEKKVKELLPDRFSKKPLIEIGTGLGRDDEEENEGIEYKIEKLRLLSQTISCRIANEETLKEMQRSGVVKKVAILNSEDSCYICKEFGKEKIFGINELKHPPPLHPGCRCVLIGRR